MTRLARLAALAAALGTAPLADHARAGERTAVEEDPAPTRAEELRRLREEKARDLAPEPASRPERFLLWLRESKLLEKVSTPGAGYKGVRPLFGSFLPNSAIGLGAMFDKPDILDGRVWLSWTYAISMREYQLGRLEAKAMPWRLRGLELGAGLVFRSRTEEQFFGLGPSSDRDDQTDFRLDDLSVGLHARVTPAPRTSLVARFDLVEPMVLDGKKTETADTDDVFDDASAPGLARQPRFRHFELLAEVDRRDRPGRPRRGGHYLAGVELWDDRDLDRFDFVRVNADLRQYIGYLQGSRVLALRAQGSFLTASGADRVPFYLAPTLGGSKELRAYEWFRFRDENAVYLGAEYRVDAAFWLELALFAEAGQVASRASDLTLDGFESDAGFGLRIGGERATALRFDFAWGGEGFRATITAGGSW